ncbi:ATP-binding protein [Actinomadura sp. 6K520]|jgi:anti-sigma regulatory factor (Ser/Thr protein kinase)|uniref:ATP-binding protein n=1 Tax=Actinomadura sp. 6K520 TaxID=2530364 RepID=UPI00104DE010|nr:ATP-binding protein [Actinomadura sp. 6K520]TDE37329.1 ATP-binding protein [Actinomadura sp. 6K520]
MATPSAQGALDVTFLAAKTAVGEVRMLVELRLAGWGLSKLTDDVSLIASELVTNAVLHVPDGKIRVTLTRELNAVLLSVWDCSDARPVRKRGLEVVAGDVAPDAASLDPGHGDGLGGRGLPIVEALSLECGVTPTEPRGKWVWARVGA